MLETANIFVTGGAGTLGRAIARRRQKEGWTGRFTVYSRDEHKHAYMRKLFPRINFIQGDIRNLETLKMAMAGHDIVIHAGAVKVIPVSEFFSIDTIDVNVFGSQNVCIAARETGVAHVLGISTDKACHPANAYGSTKMLMEKVFQEYARAGGDTSYHLVRYGNVLESTGSVVEAWKSAIAAGAPVKITDPEMTRFWLSPSQAVDYVIDSLVFDSGQVYIPMMPALSIGKLIEYVSGKKASDLESGFEIIPLRPGEKIHETLLTCEEGHYLEHVSQPPHEHFLLNPTTGKRYLTGLPPYTSDTARELTRDELEELLRDE